MTGSCPLESTISPECRVLSGTSANYWSQIEYLFNRVWALGAKAVKDNRISALLDVTLVPLRWNSTRIATASG